MQAVRLSCTRRATRRLITRKTFILSSFDYSDHATHQTIVIISSFCCFCYILQATRLSCTRRAPRRLITSKTFIYQFRHVSDHATHQTIALIGFGRFSRFCRQCDSMGRGLHRDWPLVVVAVVVTVASS